MIKFLIRGDKNIYYALSKQETVLVEGFRKLSEEAKDVIEKTTDYRRVVEK